MSRNKKKVKTLEESQTDLSIIEAVENLSSIAEMEGTDRIGVVEDHIIVHEELEDDEEAPLEAIHWLEERNLHKTETVVEDTFKAVLKYVNDFHEKEIHRFYDEKNQEGIKKIMLLVGKASDKLKTYTHLFEGSNKHGVEDTKGYQELSKFYKERIAVEDQEKVSLIDLSRKDRELELIKHPLDEENEDQLLAKKYSLSVEQIKNDLDYELLFIQKDDGSRFYNHQFYKNLKMACNFSQFPKVASEKDPLDGLKNWYDASLQNSAVKILFLINPHLRQFYQEALKFKEMEIVSTVNMAIMALMMCANPKNRREVSGNKSSADYFMDFQSYLRAALQSFEYHKLKSFPPPSSNIFLNSLMDIIDLFSWSFFFHSMDDKGAALALDDIIEEGAAHSRKKMGTNYQKPFYEQLEDSYINISRYLMNYPVGPIFKTLEIFQNGEFDGFDSLTMKNIPYEWQNLKVANRHVSILRLPTPTHQELIQKVQMDDEFSGLLDAFKNSKNKKKHLLINLQSRTDWKEHPRARYLENLSKQAEYCEYIDVVSFNVDSEFYEQKGPFKEAISITNFFKQIIFELSSEESGFYFPRWIKERIFNGFVEKLIQQIHRFFFKGRSSLTQTERVQFIDILYHFITLKLIEITNPSSLSYTCKDGLDSGPTLMGSFYGFIHKLTGQKMGKEQMDVLLSLLFTTPLLIRGRCMKAEKFNRMISVQKLIAQVFEKRRTKNNKEVINQHFGALFELPLDGLGFGQNTIDFMTKEKS